MSPSPRHLIVSIQFTPSFLVLFSYLSHLSSLFASHISIFHVIHFELSVTRLSLCPIAHLDPLATSGLPIRISPVPPSMSRQQHMPPRILTYGCTNSHTCMHPPTYMEYECQHAWATRQHERTQASTNEHRPAHMQQPATHAESQTWPTHAVRTHPPAAPHVTRPRPSSMHAPSPRVSPGHQPSFPRLTQPQPHTHEYVSMVIPPAFLTSCPPSRPSMLMNAPRAPAKALMDAARHVLVASRHIPAMSPHVPVMPLTSQVRPRPCTHVPFAPSTPHLDARPSTDMRKGPSRLSPCHPSLPSSGPCHPCPHPCLFSPMVHVAPWLSFMPPTCPGSHSCLSQPPANT